MIAAIAAITPIAAITAGCGRAAPDPTAQSRGADVAAEVPASVPPTWRRFLEWSPDCPLWLPPAADELPAPIRWEPCAADLPGRPSCRQLVIDWNHQGNPGIALSPSLSVDGGVARLFLTRVAVVDRGGPSSYLEWIVGEVDGPLGFAMRQAIDGRWRCVATEQQLREGRFGIRLRGDGRGPGLRSDVDALLLGRVGQLRPAVVLRDTTPATASWSVGARWLVRGAAPSRELFLHSPDLNARLLHSTAGDPDRLAPVGGMPLVVGDDLVYEVAGSGGHALMAYDPERGPHALVRHGDASRGDGNAGTDGKHLVWTRGEGGRPGEVHPRRSILAADYTTDPRALRPRRLRSDPNPVLGAGPMRFAVGCGFAGRNASPPRDLLLVRLADGVSWQLAGSADWSWGQLLGFTCEEAFATVFSKTQGVSIARVRLDSLGPGLAPD
jgi:hypothetical protein